MRVRVEPPAPGPNRRGLLSPGGAVRVDEPGAQWEGGLAWAPLSCEALAVRPIVCGPEADAGLDPKATPDNEQVVEYDPVYLLGGDFCSTLDRSLDHVQRARWNLSATESHQLETELWDGAASLLKADPEPNNYLAKVGGAAEVSATALPYTRALAELEQAMAECLHGQQGVVHAAPITADLWYAAGLLRVEGQRLLTPMDNIVIAGSGYSGSAPGQDPNDPPVPPGDIGAAANAYGTGLVYVRLGPVVEVGDEASQIDRTVNDWLVFVERAAAATFDPCCWFTVPVDHTQEVESAA